MKNSESSDDYYYKYIKYKTKYNNLLKLQYGGEHVGYYRKDNDMYISGRTIYGGYYSYKQVDYSSIKKEEITHNVKGNKDKIFCIETPKHFDNFTRKYCTIEITGDTREDRSFFVKWDEVSKDYKGFYLNFNHDLLVNRGGSIPVGKYMVTSWIAIEDPPTQVMIFD